MFVSNHRFADYIAAQADRDRLAEKSHDDLKNQISELSEQTRGEFKAARADIERRHRENRSYIIRLAIGIGLALLGTYLAQHGLHVPGIAVPQ